MNLVTPDCPFDSFDTLRGGTLLDVGNLSFAYGFFYPQDGQLGGLLKDALIIPLAHYDDVAELPPATVGDMWKRYLWLRAEYGAEAPGRNFYMNDDAGAPARQMGTREVRIAGGVILHPHAHFKPRHIGRASNFMGLGALTDEFDALYAERARCICRHTA
jgi:diadenosine tetraphosphate (Ap4A) HIT family hydrolase